MKFFLFIFDLNKYQSVTHVSTCMFKGLFKNIVFRSVTFMSYFRFINKKKINKKSFKLVFRVNLFAL